MTDTSASPWETKRTDETRQIEDVLRKAGFARVDGTAITRHRSAFG